MKVETIESGKPVAPARAEKFLKGCFDTFSPFLSDAKKLERSLIELRRVGDKATDRAAARLAEQLRDHAPSVTMIGQVKAGKTSLINAMVGEPGLLPADVNPWTSVITSLHMSPREADHGVTASFKFFDRDEWDRLLVNGGRIGELAGRAGADEELEKIRAQIEMMREKSRSRLGRKFELLLGQDHNYGYYDQDLIQRYVCLGDDFVDEDDEECVVDQQGRFADITKSADLQLHRAWMPMPLCIRDTPGVNDTFMIREQITIGAIRDSRTCVVVLSAHQALSSTDLALIRLISNVKSRDVIIFVNRIDELSDPAWQVPEIQESITATLEAHGGPKDAEIIFGSALWANSVITGEMNGLPEDSAGALLNWAEAQLRNRAELKSPIDIVWELSGIPALYRALGDRITSGSGKETLDKISRSVQNLASGMQVSTRLLANASHQPMQVRLRVDEVVRHLVDIENRAKASLDEVFSRLNADFATRLERSHRSFLERATASLIEHLEAYGEKEVWKYNPNALRLLLRSSYQIFGAKGQNGLKRVVGDATADLNGLAAHMLGEAAEAYVIHTPEAPQIPPPVALGQTIALDLQGSWWKRWWHKQRGYRAFASRYYDLIQSETDPIVNDLIENQAEAFRASVYKVLEDFIDEQRQILVNLANQGTLTADELTEIFGLEGEAERMKAIDGIFASLSRDAA